MFFLVGVVYERAHTRDLNELGGGIWQLAPVYGGILIFSSMASLGLPWWRLRWWHLPLCGWALRPKALARRLWPR